MKIDNNIKPRSVAVWWNKLVLTAKNPWLASCLLRQARRLAVWLRQIWNASSSLILDSNSVWSRSQAGRVRAYPRLKGVRPNKQLVLSTITGVALILSPVTPAIAGTITVNSLADNGTGGCTLGEAIVAANSNASYADCIYIPAAGTNIINMTSLSGTITLTSTLPLITQTVQMNGPLTGSLTIDGVNNYNAINGTEIGTMVGVDSLTITNVTADGIYARDSLTVTNSVVTGATNGVRAKDGNAYVNNSTVTGGDNGACVLS